ncbi:MAG: hypothetical protein NVSMB12_20070 [Acidimicrobiales bacterium]
MTPAKRPATPASQGPTRTAPDVPIVARPKPAPLAKTKDSAELLGPDGKPAQEAATRDASGDLAPPTETGQVDPEPRAKTQSQRRPGGLYPLPVWPD